MQSAVDFVVLLIPLFGLFAFLSPIAFVVIGYRLVKAAITRTLPYKSGNLLFAINATIWALCALYLLAPFAVRLCNGCGTGYTMIGLILGGIFGAYWFASEIYLYNKLGGGSMYCYVCSAETRINYGRANDIRCSKCA